MTIYVEGGGRGKDLRSRCREAFCRLFAKAGFEGRMPRVVPGGSRNDTFDDFLFSLRAGDPVRWSLLLVDSEDIVTGDAWDHLRRRDGWVIPAEVTGDQAQLMVTCMETWVMADREALRLVFGPELRVSGLLPTQNLESRTRDDVQQALETATAPCGRGRAYRKGRRSFQALAEVDPDVLAEALPHFKRLVECLESRLPPATNSRGIGLP